MDYICGTQFLLVIITQTFKLAKMLGLEQSYFLMRKTKQNRNLKVITTLLKI